MTDPLFLAEFDDVVRPGALVVVAGDEAHHAVSVKRIARGESVLLSNGHGLGLRGTVTEVAKRQLSVEVGDAHRGGFLVAVVHLERVDPVPQQAEHGGQEGHRRRHAHGHEHGGDEAELADVGDAHEDEAAEGDADRHAREEHGRS